VADLGGNGFGSFSRKNKGCALRDAPSNKLGCRAETRLYPAPNLQTTPTSPRIPNFMNKKIYTLFNELGSMGGQLSQIDAV
jgi:hypothetical protein